MAWARGRRAHRTPQAAAKADLVLEPQLPGCRLPLAVAAELAGSLAASQSSQPASPQGTENRRHSSTAPAPVPPSPQPVSHASLEKDQSGSMTQPPRAEGPRGAKPSSLAEAAASAHPQSRRATTGLKALRCCCCAPPLLLTAAYRRVSGARGAAEEAPGKRRAPAQGRAGEDGPPRGPGPATVPAHHMPAVPGSIAAVSGFSGPGSGPSPSAAAPARHAAVVCGWSHS